MNIPPIYPCLWFNNNAQQAAQFYCSVFQNARILQENPMVTTYELSGTKFMGLNGGPKYQVTPAVSYFVYCGSESEISRLFASLSEGGSVLMPLGKYDWAEKYAWVIDQFGVNWQLDMADVPTTQKIVPTLLFANHKMEWVKKAITLYTATFQPSTTLLEAPYPPSANLPEGTLLFAQFKINGFLMNAMSSTLQHDFDFSPGNSLVIECETQAQIDHYWKHLGKDGRYDMCGWLADPFGVSWQVVPTVLPKLMNDPEKGQRVIAAFLKMQKFDIETLLNC